MQRVNGRAYLALLERSSTSGTGVSLYSLRRKDAFPRMELLNSKSVQMTWVGALAREQGLCSFGDAKIVEGRKTVADCSPRTAP